MNQGTCRIAVLASGDGSNMEAIAEACADGRIAAELALVVSNVADAGVLGRARRLGLPHRCIPHRDFRAREAFEAALGDCLRAARIDLVVLAGFMRVLTDGFVREYYGSLLNIHPSLLPKYTGLDTHRRALEAGDREAGATVHFVTPQLDAGPPVLQAVVPIRADDDAAALASRVRSVEHRIYPIAVGWWAAGRLALTDGRAELDGEAISDARAMPGRTVGTGNAITGTPQEGRETETQRDQHGRQSGSDLDAYNGSRPHAQRKTTGGDASGASARDAARQTPGRGTGD